LIRLEAPLYLALSAASPFLDGKATGFHSSRWQMFPKTPKLVPLFSSHRHFVEWTEQQLQLGTMQNVRHLWSSVRPNGDNRPYNLNRLELRISDLVIDPVALLAISALLEMRLNQFLEAGIGSSLDPLAPNATKFTPDELATIADQNEVAAAINSLDAVLTHWQTGEQITAREWISNLYEELRSRAKDNGVWCFLSPLKKILEQGNEAQRWLAAYHNGISPRQIMTDAIASAEQMDKELAEALLLS
jgi:predicted glutamate--cysteine ligase